MKTGKSSKRTTRRRAVTAKRAGKPAGGGSKYGAIRRELEKQRQAILDEVGEGLTKREGPEAFPDVSDQASAEVDQNFSMRIKEREQKLLKKIDEALDRLKCATWYLYPASELAITRSTLRDSGIVAANIHP